MNIKSHWKQELLNDMDWPGEGIYQRPVQDDLGMRFHEKMPKVAALRELKDTHLHLTYWETPYYRKAITRFLNEVHVDCDTVVMDIGCGDGRFTELLVDLGYQRIVATDAHLTPLLSLQDYALRQGFADRLLIIQCDADNIPVCSRTISAILAIGVYYYLNDRYEQCLQQAARLLHNGGILINSEPDLEGAVYKSLIFEEPSDAIENLRDHHFKEEKGHTDFKFRLFSRQELPTLLEQNGFNVKEQHGLSLLPSVIRIKMVRGEFSEDGLAQQEKDLRRLLDYFDEHGQLYKHIIWKSVVVAKNNFIYNFGRKVSLTEGELADLLKDVDENLPDPINLRSYFKGYRELARRFIRNGEIIYAKDGSGLLIGCAVIYADPENYSHGFETYIGIRSKYKRLGIGRKLTEMEFEFCREIGMLRMMTNCHPNNIAKINMNLLAGYSEVIDELEIAAYVASNPKWLGKKFFIKNL